MNKFRLLLVEDDEQERLLCNQSAEVYTAKNQDRQFEIIECDSVQKALEKLDNTFDGAIIDLKLDTEPASGNKVLAGISEEMYRIPVAILTGTPSAAEDVVPLLDVFKKGDAAYSDIFDRFWEVYATGLTQILGGRGLIEQKLKQVFEQNLFPSRQAWIDYGKSNSELTKQALLRHTINHLLQLLDDDDDHYYPEEVYIHPPFREKPMTGALLKKRVDDSLYVILNPVCDLVIRQKTNTCKTDRILLVQIEDEATVIASTSDIVAFTKETKRIELTEKYLKNNHSDYYHWLPQTSFFNGGFINFRRITTVTLKELGQDFDSPHIQISPPFVKDIVARFSSYYSRQGQPDISYKPLVTGIAEASFNRAQQLKKKEDEAMAAQENAEAEAAEKRAAQENAEAEAAEAKAAQENAEAEAAETKAAQENAEAEAAEAKAAQKKAEAEAAEANPEDTKTEDSKTVAE